MADKKVFEVQLINGIYTIPDLILDWDDILSDKYKLWEKYKYPLLQFYYSPNHEGSCLEVAKEFKESPSSINDTINNFCKLVQKKVNTFILKQSDNQYWPIAFDGIYDENKNIIWRLKPELVKVIINLLNRQSSLKEQFLREFPLESLRSMSLEKYTNLNRNDSFCYWLESRTEGLGSIWGGNALKFGIYQYDKPPKDGANAVYDEKYCWQNKYNCSSYQEAFELVRDRIATIAEKASAGELKVIEDIDIGDAVKWKVANLYSNDKVINIYAIEYLQAAAKDLGFTGNYKSHADLNDFIVSHYDPNKESFFDFYMRVGIHYFGKMKRDRNYWLTGYTISNDDSRFDKFIDNGIWECRFNDGSKSDQILLSLAKTIKKQDVILLKATGTKGLGHKESYLRIKAVGIVTSDIVFSKIEGATLSKCDIIYVNTDTKDFDGTVYGSYRKSIHKVDSKVNDIIDYANSLISQEKMPENNTMQQGTANKYQNYITLLRETHNLVLTGAPGTGKTFMAQAIAAEMGAETKFVQFHPSYDYTDFVEGLRPIEKDNGQMGFERKDGVFKEFCREAIKNLADSKKSVASLIEEMSWPEKLEHFVEDSIVNKITFTTVTGKEFVISDMDDRYIKIHNENNEKTPDISVNTEEILALLTNDVSLKNVKDIREYFNHTFGTQSDSYTFVIVQCVRDLKNFIPEIVVDKVKEKDFVFIIDEINRGEASKIFGELFYAIDPGYRGKKDHLVHTQYQNLVPATDIFAKGFYVPDNVYILATMNDIDRSVESMDFAMRRRFTWKEITPEDTASMLDILEYPDDAKATMNRLNKVIAETDGLGPAYMIGPSYYLKLGVNGFDFNKLWDMNIKPLLKEYLRGFRNAKPILANFYKAYFDKMVNEDQPDR